MTLSLVTAPAVEPVTLDEAKTHMRVEHVLEDALIGTYIVSARQHAEAETARALLEQTWELALPCFPFEPCLKLPRPPLVAVVEVRYFDAEGVDQVWPASEYDVDAPAGPHARQGVLRPKAGTSWPTVQVAPRAVRVTFRAGYGDSADKLPASLKAAVLLATSDLYDKREPGAAVTRLLAPFRVELGA
jgi:uncharacterized phiE125 gp8 family phage protein